MRVQEVAIDIDGSLRFVVSDATVELESVGRCHKFRASHVEPVLWPLRMAFRLIRWFVRDDSRSAAWCRMWPCQWVADLQPVNGPRLGPFGVRADAIDAEIDWLNRNFI